MSKIDKKSRKVTIRDVLDEHELELLGITTSVDGSPVNSSRKRSEFFEDSGMYDDPVLLEIQSRYRGRLRDNEVRKQYLDELFNFTNGYFHKKIKEYLTSLQQNK